MKVVHLIPNLKNGGAENVLINIIIRLNFKNISQSVFTLENSEKDFNFKKIKDKIEIYCLKERADTLKDLLVKYPKAIVICWLYKAIFYYEKYSFKHNLKNKFYWNIRHSDFGKFQIKQKFFLFLMGVYSNFSNCMIIYCSERSKSTHESFLFKRKQTIVIPNRLAKSPPTKIKTPDEKKYLLFIGRKHPQKNPRFLKTIFQYLTKNHRDISLVIIGDGWTKEFFKTQSESLIIHNQKENIFDYLNHTICLLFTSRYGEGYPNVIAEAMSVGANIIGFDSGDFSLMTKNYEPSKTVTSENNFLIELNSLIHNYSLNNHPKLISKIIAKELNFELTVKQYLSLI